jgi:hypothetical protein
MIPAPNCSLPELWTIDLLLLPEGTETADLLEEEQGHEVR